MHIAQQRGQPALRHKAGHEHGRAFPAGDPPIQTVHGFFAHMQSAPAQRLFAHPATGVFVTRIEEKQITGLCRIFPVVAENPPTTAIHAADDVVLMKMSGKVLQQPVKPAGFNMQIRVKADHARLARHSPTPC